MPYDKSPMVLGNRIPYGRGSLEGAEPPYADGYPHGRVGPVTPGDPGSWVIVPADVPYDGRLYVRQNRGWVVTTVLESLPNDLASIYGRKRHLIGPDTWEMVVGEAPGDNRLYARENGMWVPFTSLGEAPTDARMYGRTGGTWAWACNEAPTNIMATFVYGRRDGQWFEVPIELENEVILGVPYGRLRLGDQTIWVRTVLEAPLDTTLRGRQNGQWVPIAPSLGDAPNDGYHYGRFNQTWAEVLGELPENAPTNKSYARTRRLWLEVPRDVTVNSEGPLADGLYVRKKEGTTGSWVSAPTGAISEDAPVDATFYARKGTPITDPTPRWQQIPMQDEAPVNDNLYARRNRLWQECPEEAPTVGSYVRRYHQWIPVTEALFGPWQVLPFFTPNDWVTGSELRYRTLGTSQIEFTGSLTPVSPIAGNGFLPIGQPSPGHRPTISQYTTIVVLQTQNPDVRTIGGIRIVGGSGLLTLYGLGPQMISIPDIHLILALT